MTILWAEGFDHYGTTPNGGRDAMLKGAWAAFADGSGNLPIISSTHSRTGTYALKCFGGPGVVERSTARRVLGASKLAVGCGYGVYPDALPSVNGTWGMSIRDSANDNILKVSVESDGSLGFYKGSGYTLIARSDPIVTAASWSHIEVKCVIDNVVGSIDAQVNGISVFSLTNQNLGTNAATQLTFGCFAGSGSGTTVDFYFDDIVVWDTAGSINNTFLGTQRVETIFPTSDTAVADFSKTGSANGYACINNVPPDDDTTYLAAAVVNNKSEFGVGSLPANVSAIVGVFVHTLAKLSDAGTGNLQVSLVSGVSVSDGPDKVLTSGYQYHGGVHQLDPATSAAWTKAGVEAAKLRLKKTV